LDQPRATFGTIAGFWNLQNRTKHVLLPDNLKRGGESVISGIPDWTGLVLVTSDGRSYVPGVDKSTVKSFHQSLSIRNGVVHTNITWSPINNAGEDASSVEYQLNFTVLAHRTRPNVGIVRLDLSASEETNCTIIDVLDGAGAVRAHFGDKLVEQGENSIWTSVKPWGIKNVTAYVFSTVDYESSDYELLHNIGQTRGDATGSPWVSQNLSTVAQSWNFRLTKGQPVTVFKFVGIASSDDFYDRAFTIARESATEAKNIGWDSMIREHMLAWDRTWESADIVIPGDPELQAGVRASLFHVLTTLRSGNKEDKAIPSHNSVTVGGLSSDSYAGLVFWDADTWLYPSVLALQPDFAMSINNYRTRLLPQAIENAQSYGYSGALFPWTSGRFGNCTGTGVCKDYQYHLNTDIVLAHWQYFQHTRDVTWLSEKGWPIIKSVADMFAAYVVFNDTTGEYETLLVGEPVSLELLITLQHL
jgi:trehalose/maltose hydrolase-like predicted phosphorylase